MGPFCQQSEMQEMIFITGTSRGLGRALAEAYLAKGATVLGCSRGESKLSESFPKTYRHATLDLEDPESAKPALRAFFSERQGFDRVILNAGMLPPIRDIGETAMETLRETMEVNLWSNKWILDSLLAMPSKPPQIVAISSGAAVSGSRGWNGYSLSKAALNMLIKLYAEEEPEVHFIALAPGLVETAMQDAIRETENAETFATVQRLKAARGTPDMPSPDEAAQRIIAIMDDLTARPSGEFVDIRKMMA